MRIFFVALVLWCGALGASGSPTLPLDVTSEEAIDAGLRSLYQLDYAGAKTSFASVASAHPDNPVGPYGLTMALWWELTNEFDESNDTLEQQFLSSARQTVDLSKRWVKNGDPSGEGRLCWGGALGLVARWDAIQGHWLSAYRNGKQAFTLQTKVLETHPDLYDAYLGPGIFHYYVATLPATVKILARMVFGGGSKEQGLSEIRVAMERGRFSKTAARLFLVNILTNNEKNPGAALALLREGRKDFPDSPFFQFAELLVLEEARSWEEVEAGARDFINRIDTRRPHYSPRWRHRGEWSLANSYLGRGRAREALDLYDAIVSNATVNDRWITWTYLNRGKAHQALGQIDEARRDFETVLHRRDVWELHDKAKHLLRGLKASR